MLIGILIGTFIGAIFGIFITALASANSRINQEDDYEQFERKD